MGIRFTADEIAPFLGTLDNVESIQLAKMLSPYYDDILAATFSYVAGLVKLLLWAVNDTGVALISEHTFSPSVLVYALKELGFVVE